MNQSVAATIGFKVFHRASVEGVIRCVVLTASGPGLNLKPKALNRFVCYT